jgi:omega-6 fatty acid desaturase (delta-12 desaturase)
MIRQHAQSSDIAGTREFLVTLVPLALLWWGAVAAAAVSYWLVAACVPLITLFTLRVFALMHECGHGSLFRSCWLNRAAGFVLGVVAGMPQYVWSQHHNYHHAHNGDWEKYRGPYATLSVDEYAALSRARQRLYRQKCSAPMAPVAGLIYLIINPRLTWMKGTVGLLVWVIRQKLQHPGISLRAHAASYKTRYWKTAREYRHMLWNNLVLLSLWAAMSWACGATFFFTVYLLSVSIAGAIGIMLFTVQHNFEHAYATDSEHWDHDTGAIAGTSFLVLPGWMNWFTSNIGYHHIHHLSASIPGYRLRRCHAEYQSLYDDVTRLTLSQVHAALKCILWDRAASRIITVAEYRQQV